MRLPALVLVVWFACGGLIAPVSGAESAQHAVPITLEGDLLRVAVDRQEGRLLELVDVTGEHDMLQDGPPAGGLWQLEVLRDGRPAVLNPEQAETFRSQIVAAGRALKMSWSDFSVPWASACQVEVTVRLDAKLPLSRWKIAVAKPAGLALSEVRFPRAFGLTRQRDERLAVPTWMGQMAANPRRLLRGADGRGRRLAWAYPARLSMQCLAYYGRGGQGLYAACDDTAAIRKTFSFWGTPEGRVNFQTVHYPQNQAAGSERYVLPYRVVLGTFQGDWLTAAARYRAWAVQQPWAKQSRLGRGLVPQWVLKTGLWVWNRGRSDQVLLPAAELQRQLGLPVSVFWHWWHGCPYDIGFPEYFPPREGTEPFRRAVADAQGDGLRAIVYMNQRGWGMSTKSWKEEGAERFAVKGKDGKVRPEVYNIFTGKALASMCLATPFWRNKYAGLAERAYGELGVDGIYMDQACSQLPCYDPDHGHPLGGGNSWIEGFGSLAGDIRKRCGSERPVVLAGEGCGEAWLPYLDLMLTLQLSKERYSPATNPWEVIPFFQAVYHQYVVTYGSYSSLTMPPYDELWPAEFAPAEPLATLDRKYSRQFYLEQARAFVWGHQPTLANFLPRLLRQRPEEMQFVMRLARVRSRAAKYLLNGQFLRPPKLDVPEVTSDFSRLSIYAGQKSRLTSYQKQHPLAIAGAWRAADGDLAVALASVAGRPLTISLALDAACYGLAKTGQVLRIDESGRQQIEPPGDDRRVLKLELPARGAWIIEFPRATR